MNSVWLRISWLLVLFVWTTNSSAGPVDATAKVRQAIRQAGGTITEVQRDGKEFWKVSFDELTDAKVMSLKGADPVISLEVFDASKLSEKSLAILKYTPKLEELNLYKPKFAGSGFSILKSTPDLKILAIGESPRLGDVIAEPLKSLKKLEILDLNGSMVGDKTMAAIKDLPELQEINFSNTKVTNASIKLLVDAPKLRTVQVIGCGMTEATEKILIEKFPKLNIRR